MITPASVTSASDLPAPAKGFVMSIFKFDARARLTVEIALTAGERTASRDQWQEAEARLLGMSGAEIDVARQGRSFDVRMSSAIALATAEDIERDLARTKAIRAGVSKDVCEEIEQFAISLAAARNAELASHA
jgi:hypothetical protein